MGKDVRVTAQLQRVILLFLRNPSEHYYGLQVAREAGLQRGTLYPILARLEAAGWVTSEWETIDPSVEGRRPRRYYRLTDDGLRHAERIRDEAIAALPPAWGTART